MIYCVEYKRVWISLMMPQIIKKITQKTHKMLRIQKQYDSNFLTPKAIFPVCCCITTCTKNPHTKLFI